MTLELFIISIRINLSPYRFLFIYLFSTFSLLMHHSFKLFPRLGYFDCLADILVPRCDNSTCL